MDRSPAKGALVILVMPGSPAQAAGLSPGDVIVAIDGRPIGTELQMVVLLRSSDVAEHDLTILDPSGAAKELHIQARARPLAGVADLVLTQVAADPGPASRLLFAQLTSNPATALVVLDKLIGEFPDVAEAYATRAQRLLEIGVARNDTSREQVSAIRAAVERAIAIDPTSLAVQLTATQVLATLSDYPAATGHAQAALAIDETSSFAHRLLGRLRLDQGDPSAAVMEFRRAIQLDPYTGDSYRALSDAYRALGHTDLARGTDEALHALVRTGSGPAGRTQKWPALAVLVAISATSGAALALLRRRGPPLPEEPLLERSRLAAMEVLGVLAVASLALPWVGRALDLSAGAPIATEVVDHAVPGAVVLAAVTLIVRQLLRQGGTPSGRVGLFIWFAAFWMTATHVPLLLDTVGGHARIEVAVFHSIPGIAMLAITTVAWCSATMETVRPMSSTAL